MRTINSPGVEFNEVDVSQTANVPTGTTALVVGFTDQGKSLEPFQITTPSEYEAVFGTPTNEAEIYSYYAAREVVDAGGNLIMAKLPYSNTIDTNYRGTAITIETPEDLTVSTVELDKSLESDDVALLQNSGVTKAAKLILDNRNTITEAEYEQLAAGGDLASVADAGAAAADFLIVQKNKTTISDRGEGYFISVVDPIDAMYYQYMLESNREVIKSFGYDSNGYVALPTATDLYKDVEFDSFSEKLSRQFPTITWGDGGDIIDTRYNKYIGIALCKVYADPENDGQLTATIKESWHGSIVRDAKDPISGVSVYIGDVINNLSSQLSFFYNQKLNGDTGNTFKSLSDTGLMVYKPYVGQTEPTFAFTIPTEPALIRNQLSASDQTAYDAFVDERRATELEIDTLSTEGKVVYYQFKLLQDAYDTSKTNYDSDVLAYAAFVDKGAPTQGELDTLSDKGETELLQFLADLDDFTNFHSNNNYSYVSFSASESIKRIVGGDMLVNLRKIYEKLSNLDETSIGLVVDAGLSTIAEFMSEGEILFDPTNKMMEPAITSKAAVGTWRSIVSEIDTFCQFTRKDCLGLADGPRNLVLSGDAKILDKSNSNTFAKTIGKSVRYITGLNSSYVAMDVNWVKIIDGFSGKAVWLPPSIKTAGACIKTDINYNVWDAPAGTRRGVLRGVIDISFNPSRKECDQLYTKALNYIRYYPKEGFIREGQRTTLSNETSSLSRINVRRLYLYLERVVYDTLRHFVNEPLNDYTFRQVVDIIDPIFKTIKNKGGMYNYELLCNDKNNTFETIARNELKFAAFVQPTLTGEFIEARFINTPPGADFAEYITAAL
jgi:hypothetical protein